MEPLKKPKRRRPTPREIAKLLPPELSVSAMLPSLMKTYLPRLRKESLERIQNFILWKAFRNAEQLQIMTGEKWMSLAEEMSLLRMMRGAGWTLPGHLKKASAFHKPEHSKEKCSLAAMFILRRNIEAGNARFFRQLANLMEEAPPMEDFKAFEVQVFKCLKEKRFLYSKSDSSKRGRNYLQRLLLAVTNLLIAKMHRLPFVSEVRQIVAALMEKPPGKRELEKALVAIGLAGVNPPVLEP